MKPKQPHPDRTRAVAECKAMRRDRNCLHECSFFHPAAPQKYPAFCAGALSTAR